MTRKAHIVGLVALGLMATAVHTPSAVGRVVTSAQSVHSHFRDLGQAGNPLSPFERLVFSLVLAKSTPQTCSTTHPTGAPSHT